MKFRDVVPFHKTMLAGNEAIQMLNIVESGNWNEPSAECMSFFETYYPTSKSFFTNSCTSALEMALRALCIGPGDEVIIPGYGYVAVANAIVNNGATPVYADVNLADGNMNIASMEACVTKNTKAIIAIHYAGNLFDGEVFRHRCDELGIYFIEDAAQAIGSYLHGFPAGSFGHIGTLSFDYMKNVTCGQGGLLIVNDQALLDNVWVAYEEGTDRHQFSQGRTQFYQWVGKGNNSYINPLATYFLSEQLRHLAQITQARKEKWMIYHKLLQPLAQKGKVIIPAAENVGNGHIFYLLTKTTKERSSLRQHVRQNGIYAEFHYVSLAGSAYGSQYAQGVNLIHSDTLATCLLRLPFWNGITENEISITVDAIASFYGE